jgi:hypothetical protein
LIVVPLHANDIGRRADLKANETVDKDTKKQQPVPCALSVATTLAAVEATRAARTNDRRPR